MEIKQNIHQVGLLSSVFTIKITSTLCSQETFSDNLNNVENYFLNPSFYWHLHSLYTCSLPSVSLAKIITLLNMDKVMKLTFGSFLLLLLFSYLRWNKNKKDKHGTD